MLLLMGFLLVIGGGAHWAGRREGARYDDRVTGRLWESTVLYGDEEFQRWVRSGEPSVKGYARVLAPYDLILLVSLGAALAAGSLAAAAVLHPADGGRWVVTLTPLAFSVADFLEDRLLLDLIAARDATLLDVKKLKKVTLVKLCALTAAVSQTVVLGLWALLAS